MIQNEDYELIPHENDDWAIRILTGEFVETEYTYGTICIREWDDETGTVDGGVRYYVTVLKTPRTEDLTNNLEFQSLTGDILIDVYNASVNKEGNQKS